MMKVFKTISNINKFKNFKVFRFIIKVFRLIIMIYKTISNNNKS